MRLPSVLVHTELCRELDEASMSCAGQPESGGILLGCYRGDDMEVTGRTLPGAYDGRHAFAFVRVDTVHQAAASRAWSGSGGTHTWVGEWHTHPSGAVEPSPMDLRSWARLARGTGLPMVFAVAAPREWGLFLTRPSWVRCNAIRLALVERGSMGLVFAAAPRAC